MTASSSFNEKRIKISARNLIYKNNKVLIHSINFYCYYYNNAMYFLSQNWIILFLCTNRKRYLGTGSSKKNWSNAGVCNNHNKKKRKKEMYTTIRRGRCNALIGHVFFNCYKTFSAWYLSAIIIEWIRK